MKIMKIYFIIMVAVWLPWGIQCIFNISNITEIIGVSALNPNGTTDIRVMYGGVQTGLGLMALIAFFKPSLGKYTLFSLAMLGSCMALTRSYGVVVDGSTSLFNLSVLAFEGFTGISSGFLLTRDKLK